MDASHQNTLTQLNYGENHEPHLFLGLHSQTPKNKIIRLWRPEAQKVYVELEGTLVEAEKVHESGLFVLTVSPHVKGMDYKIYHHNGLLAHDPYAFTTTIGEVDHYLFSKGTHYQIYSILGANFIKHQGVEGVRFAVWAPSAKRVSLVGDFNFWDGRVNPMRSLGQSGIWEIFVPGLKEGERYKFEVKTQTNALRLKADPYAYASEYRPATASIVTSLTNFSWTDKAWMDERIQRKDDAQPLNIYEVHLGSWKKNEGEFKNYRQLAHELTAYCLEMGFTHVELLPIQEHPLDDSWGYQVSGYYAVTSRFGTPEDFQYFVNYLHQQKIGVILDWVPGHFPTDDFALNRFDGTALYEHEDPRLGFHPHWKTNIFNFGRHEVANFLIANALFWFEKMHIDGLRVDAVASILYLDYGREGEEWIPNKYGGKENLEAIEFLKHLNSIVHEKFPDVLMIAEESTSFTGVSKPVAHGGLGFDMKWNMGWMNDSLRYFSREMSYRPYHQNELTFGLLYAFSEKFVLVLSHDEVVHGKNSLLGRMPGDTWQKFANFRLLYSYMMCQPGKKLLFMGGEIGQWNEWNCKREIEWDLLKYPIHSGIHRMVKELNHLYLKNPPLWERDFDHAGFEWVDFSDQHNSVIIYLRKSRYEQLLCVHNFTSHYQPEYFIHLPKVTFAEEVFNSDAIRYGGSGKENPSLLIVGDEKPHSCGLKLQLSPLSTLIFKVAL